MFSPRNILRVAGLALALVAGAAAAHEYKLGDIEIIHPTSRAMLEGQPVGGGFLTIINHGTTDDRLVSATSERAGEVQLHEMAMENDVMKMRQLKDGIPVPAGATVELKKGGLHVMFMGVKEGFKEGEMIKATLTFEKAGSVEVEFKVGPANGDGQMQMQHGNGEMDHTKHGAAAMDHTKHAAAGGMMMDQPADPQMAIPAVMKAMFETDGKMLDVAPVVVEGDWAIAGWLQDGKGGRALLKKGDMGWAIHLCSGDSLLDAAALEKIGLDKDAAGRLAMAVAEAEKPLADDVKARFASFEGTVMMH